MCTQLFFWLQNVDDLFYVLKKLYLSMKLSLSFKFWEFYPHLSGVVTQTGIWSYRLQFVK